MENGNGIRFEYARDIVDEKLLAIRLVQKLWIVLLSAAAGALLFGGGYFATMRLLPPQKEYEARLSVFVEYRRGEEEPLGWVCFTQDAWKEFAVSDDFTENVVNRLNGEVTKEEYHNSLSSILLPDGRVLTIVISTDNADKSVRIAQAVIAAIDDFGATQDRILWTKPLTVPETAVLKLLDDRTVNMTVLGAVLGLVFSLLFVWYLLVTDDSVYVPELFECRYGLPAVDIGQKEEAKECFRYLAEGKNPVLYAVDEEKDATDHIKTQIETLTGRPARIANITDREVPAEQDAVYLLVKAGAHNGKRVEKQMHLLMKKGTPPTAALLYGTDEKLLKKYYGSVWKKTRKQTETAGTQSAEDRKG